MTAVMALIWSGSYGSTTVDQICEQAKVKKGTFYYFFESKSDLALAAVEDGWVARKQSLDAIFSPTVAPLDKIQMYCEQSYQKQCALKKQSGRVLGCPLFNLGSEICSHEKKLHAKIKEILGYYHTYLESAIREAHAAGLLRAPDPAAKARMLFAYCEGLLTQARILNDPELLREMFQGAAAILGVDERRLAVA